MAQVTKFPVSLADRGKVGVDTAVAGSQPAGLPAGSDLATVSSAPQECAKTLEKALGHQVRLLRRERDLSAAELGRAAGISLGMISKIENGQISPLSRPSAASRMP
ncbi:hypothetical protein GCM10025880_12850 [Methylorubrum aminovorans]|nr:hypothetical protein GCM10025880_12850 [Methylorubrum aminovorans]